MAGKFADERTHAHTWRSRNLGYSGTICGQRLAESLAHVIGKRPCRIVFRERQLQSWHQNQEELRISVDHRECEYGLIESGMERR